MVQRSMSNVIERMHFKLNKLIESNNYDLLNNDVIRYSQRLDRVLLRYSKKNPDTKETSGVSSNK